MPDPGAESASPSEMEAPRVCRGDDGLAGGRSSARSSRCMGEGGRGLRRQGDSRIEGRREGRERQREGGTGVA